MVPAIRLAQRAPRHLMIAAGTLAVNITITAKSLPWAARAAAQRPEPMEATVVMALVSVTAPDFALLAAPEERARLSHFQRGRSRYMVAVGMVATVVAEAARLGLPWRHITGRELPRKPLPVSMFMRALLAWVAWAALVVRERPAASSSFGSRCCRSRQCIELFLGGMIWHRSMN